MKKILAPLVVATMMLSNGAARAATVELDVPAGFVGGSAHNFTFGDTWGNIGMSAWAYMDFYEGKTNTLVYEKGAFDFDGMSLNARPWDGFNDRLPDQPDSHLLSVSFLDLKGQVISSSRITLASSDLFQRLDLHVAGVHAIQFNSQGPEQFFPRLRSIDLEQAAPVPEAPAYGMLLAGLAAMTLWMRRRVGH